MNERNLLSLIDFMRITLDYYNIVSIKFKPGNIAVVKYTKAYYADDSGMFTTSNWKHTFVMIDNNWRNY